MMRIHRSLGSLILVLLLGGCSLTGTPPPNQDPFAALVGPYQATPLVLDVGTTSTLDAACRSELPPAIANEAPRLAIVDARGFGAATLTYLTPDRVAALCTLSVGPDRAIAVVAVNEARLGVARPENGSFVSVPQLTEDVGGVRWSVEQGVVGPSVARLIASLADGTEIDASIAEGMYVAAWPDSSRPVGHRSEDAAGNVLFEVP